MTQTAASIKSEGQSLTRTSAAAGVFNNIANRMDHPTFSFSISSRCPSGIGTGRFVPRST